MPDQGNGKTAAWARTFTLVVTNISKLAGVVAALNELLVRDNTTTVRASLIVVMIAGVQAFEGMVLSMLDRVFGRPPEKQ